MALELVEAAESTLNATRNKPVATNLQITIDFTDVASGNNVYDGNAAPPTAGNFLIDVIDGGEDTVQQDKPNVNDANN